MKLTYSGCWLEKCVLLRVTYLESNKGGRPTPSKIQISWFTVVCPQWMWLCWMWIYQFFS